MTTLNNNPPPDPQDLQYQMDDLQDDRVPFFLILLTPFIIAAISVAALPVANYFVVAGGIVCTLGYLVCLIQDRFLAPKEIILFWLFIMWSLMGIFTAYYPALFFQKFFTLCQLSVMVLIIAHFAKNLKTVNRLLIAVLIGIGIVALSAYITGEYQKSESDGPSRIRIAGFALNSNTFALNLVFATAILLYFFKTTKSWILKSSIITILFIFTRLIVASGSRKGFICFLLLLFVWYCFAYGREIRHRPIVALPTLIIPIALAAYLYLGTSGTLLEQRLEKITDVVEGREGGRSIRARLTMVREASQMIGSSPLAGVALDHFRVRSRTGKYSHNNYAEVFANTGIPGGLLYYAIFLVLGLRLRRLGKILTDPHEIQFVNTAKAFLFIRLVIDLGAVSYFSKTSWIILAIFFGWSWQKEKQLEEDDFNSEEQVVNPTSEPAEYLPTTPSI